MSSSSIDTGIITIPEVPNTPPSSPIETVVGGITEEVAVAATEEVAVIIKDVLPDCLNALIEKVLVEITEVPEVADILRHVPQFIAAVHTLTDKPGAEKRDLVLKGLHILVEKLEAANKISGEFRGQLDAFVDVTVPVSIDAMLDIVKGRVSFESLVQQTVANPAATAQVVSTALTCCLGFWKTVGKKKSAVVMTAPPAEEAVAEAKPA